MDPYGTSHRRLTEVDNLFWTLTWNYLPDRYGLYQSITSCENSKDSIFRSNILWSKVSNAFWRSIKIIPYNANSLTSGGRHPHFKGFTRLSKQLPFLLDFYLTKHINEKWIVNTVFFANQIEIWDTVFQKCSHTYPIDKDMSLTFWLMWLSLFLFLWLFFHWNSLVKVSHSAKCNMTNILWVFVISNLWNHSKAWEPASNICQFCTRVLCDN